MKLRHYVKNLPNLKPNQPPCKAARPPGYYPSRKRLLAQKRPVGHKANRGAARRAS